MNFYTHILGSGAAIPTLNRNCSSQYVFCNNRHILLDCGEGTQLQLRRNKIHFQRISHIFISHLHGDHFFGLPGLLSTLNLMGRNEGIQIYGPEPLHDLLESMISAGGYKLSFELNFKPLKKGEMHCIFEDDILKLHSFPLNHRIPTWGIRIDEKQKPFGIDIQKCKEMNIGRPYFERLKQGKDIEVEGSIVRNETLTKTPKKSFSYAYCSDTKFDESLIDFINGVDVLYHESTFLNMHKQRAKETYHSTAQEAALIAKKANVKRLILGHFSSRYKETSKFKEEAIKEFEHVVLAEDNLKISIEE